jgi:hypothetical protein
VQLSAVASIQPLSCSDAASWVVMLVTMPSMRQ